LSAIRKAVAVRSRTNLLLLLIALACAAAAGIAVGVALATPGEGTVGTLLARGSNPEEVTVHTDAVKFKTQGPTDIVVVTQTWQPGGHSGWHSHPGPVLFTLKEGTLSVFDRNCNAREITAGEAFVEPVGEPMEVKNYGTVPAVAYFAIVLAPGELGRVDEPNPGCNIP
jgi:quercetin dioxygenase-like cupin family protein